MTERLADINARIGGIDQLRVVVNAMRGIAATRARQARSQLAAVDSYAATIAQAIGSMLEMIKPEPPATDGTARPALLVFCTEQGFVGSFNEHVLDALGPLQPGTRLLLIGNRGLSIARERGLQPFWSASLPSHSAGIPKLAERITEAVFTLSTEAQVSRLDAVFSVQHPDNGIRIEHRHLFPLDPVIFPRTASCVSPLLNLDPGTLLAGFTADYVHAQVCRAALHAFAAENEARLQAMGQARDQIERRLKTLKAAQQVIRQEEITAEIIELAAGETAARRERARTGGS